MLLGRRARKARLGQGWTRGNPGSWGGGWAYPARSFVCREEKPHSSIRLDSWSELFRLLVMDGLAGAWGNGAALLPLPVAIVHVVHPLRYPWAFSPHVSLQLDPVSPLSILRMCSAVAVVMSMSPASPVALVVPLGRAEELREKDPCKVTGHYLVEP